MVNGSKGSSCSIAVLVQDVCYCGRNDANLGKRFWIKLISCSGVSSLEGLIGAEQHVRGVQRVQIVGSV